ncbi:MAG: STAS-like domain-containing protein [Bradymonadia bacterium]
MNEKSQPMKVRIPVALASMGADRLDTEAQAQRMMAGLERYDAILLDFRGVDEISPIFAEHVFRQFTETFPSVHLDYANTCPGVESVIQSCMHPIA